jgi:putative spermidine/putrescine transport system permease protein
VRAGVHDSVGADGVSDDPALTLPSPASGRGRARGASGLHYGFLLAPAVLLFLGFFVVPLGIVAVFSFLSGNPVQNPNVRWTTRHYDRLLGDLYYADVLWTTIRLGLWTTLVTLVIGYPLAHQLARLKSPLLRSLLLMAVLAPLLIGIVIRTYAWMTILADQGVINTALAGLGLAKLPLMYNEFGIVVALVHIYVPFMVLTLTGVIGRIDIRLEEAARGLGAGRFRTFLEVTLPLSLPGIVAGSLLVFALAISAYVTPILMGGFTTITLPILIYQQLSGTLNLGFAGALGVVLLSVSLVLVVCYNQALGRSAGARSFR